MPSSHKCNRTTMIVYPTMERGQVYIDWYCRQCGNFGRVDADGVPEATGTNRSYIAR